MAASGTPIEAPGACPFVALELDRDRRSDRPDYRHRCFAEPTPAPRSIAHQEAYCLSPKFAACPIFQDWAVRAAARPVATPKPMGGPATGAAVLGAAGVGTDGDAESVPASVPEPGAEAALEPAPPPLVPLPPPIGEAPDSMADQPYPPSAWDDIRENEQLGVFDPRSESPHSSFGQPDAGYMEPPETPDTADLPAYVAPPSRPQAEQGPESREAGADAAVPAFLAARSARPQTPLPPPHPAEKVKREDLVPSWEIDGRYGAEAGPEPSGDRLGGLLTAVAVVAILALGVAAVIFLPGLLAGGGASKTPAPSFVGPSILPSALPSSFPSIVPTVAPPSVTPTVGPPSATPAPTASPRLYRIKSGDSLARIAKHFKVTVADILAANPQIQDANHIEVGQVIVIPPRPPSPTEAPSAAP